MLFYECKNLQNITIPNSIDFIDDSFNGCVKLQEIVFEGLMEEWNRISRNKNWKNSIPATVIKCNDGNISIN